ncbi:MAG: glycosyltransferase family 2 protein, partial [Bacteroidota bacterium]
MTSNFLVSIIIPSYNSEETLATTFDSVLSQTHTNWELILVDDHSSDQSISIAQTYAAKDGRIKVVPLTANLGTANARNIGIEKSTGAYIAFLDSDDTWVPAKLETQLQYIQKASLHFTYSAYYKVYKSRKPTHVVTVPRQTGYRSMMTDPFINTSTVLLSRPILTNAPFKNYHYEDLALWLQLLRQGVKMGGINEFIYPTHFYA